MAFSKEFFSAVEDGDVAKVIHLLELDLKQSDINQIIESEGSDSKDLSALAITINKLVEVSQRSSILEKAYTEITLYLLMNGADVDVKYNFPNIPEPVTPFTYLCLKGNVNVVQTLYDYFNVTVEKRDVILGLMKKNDGNIAIIKFLENPSDYSYLYPESYKQLANSKTKLVDGAQLILKDYYAPVILEFLHWPALQRLLTCHANRHKDNLTLAELHVKGIEDKKSELEITSPDTMEDLLLQEYISRLLRLNQFIILQIENNKMNPHGSFCRRMHFLNQDLVKYVLDEQRRSARATPSTPITIFQPIQASAGVITKPVKVNPSRLPCGKHTAQELFKVMNLVEGHVSTGLPFHPLVESSYLNFN